MTTAHEGDLRFIEIPQWDLTDRLRKSLRTAHMTTSDMADYLGVQRSTINTWTSGRITPGIAALRAWAMATNVPFEWLRDGGIQVIQPSRQRGAVRRQGLEPRTRWLRACPTPVERVAAPFGFDRPALVVVEAAA